MILIIAPLEKKILEKDIPEHTVGVEFILNTLINPEYGAIKSLDEINAVGHRMAVSYTHLDVYKRQVMNNISVITITMAIWYLESGNWIRNNGHYIAPNIREM